ncbi:MAG: RES family NAD+ phosphorylase [Luteolibacter sp.]|uniref:RES family NAD+ phosphorylase n=1 Tax=Luteolibacter sp. TaxID=1962973 RepID=UPI003266EE3A
MPLFYRIVQESWADSAFDGEGARLYGGRWNSPGVPAVYLAESRALAALEILVHAPREALRLNWIVIELDVPDSLIDKVPSSKLPENWRLQPSSQQAQVFGTRWLRDFRNLALLLPSVVIPEEKSLLLNPKDPAMRDLKPGKPKPFSFDPRLAASP